MSIEELNIAMFDEAVEYLQNSRRHMDSQVAEVVRNAVKNFNISRFLDVGCGLGFLTNLLHDVFPSANGLGIDASDKLVQAARSRSVAGLEFQQGNAYSIAAKDDAFDLTACQTLLIHLKNPQQAISEMMRVTNPSGHLLFIEPIIHEQGFVGYVPGEASVKKRLRDRLHQFDFAQKQKGGIDMTIATKIPILLMEAGASEVKVGSVNIINLASKTSAPSSSSESYNSYEQLMINLGFERAAIDQLKSAEREYPCVRGELSIVTLLVIAASARQGNSPDPFGAGCH